MKSYKNVDEYIKSADIKPLFYFAAMNGRQGIISKLIKERIKEIKNL